MVRSSIIHRIDTLRDELRALQPLSKEAEEELWNKLRLEWNYNSNHIEGNTLTYTDTKLLFMFEKTTGDHTLREYEEMKAHDVAVMLIRDWAQEKDRPLSETNIRELNKIILVKPYWKNVKTPDGQPSRKEIKVGTYKADPNHVELPNGEIFKYAEPEDVPAKMEEMIDWFRTNSEIDPTILAAEMHYRFIRIHPFDDGNGRVARLLANYVLMLNDLPPVVIKSAEKQKYLTALQKADAGNRDAFHTYMAEQLIWSLELNLKAAKGEDLEEDDDWKKKAAQKERALKSMPKVVHRSDAVIQMVMEDTYIPFLQKVKKTLEHIDTFFETTAWHTYLRERPRTYLDMAERLFGMYDDELPFDELLEKIVNSFETGVQKGFYRYHRILHKFENYSDNDLNFEMSVVIDIDFGQTSFGIVALIGNDAEMGKMGLVFQKMSEDEPGHLPHIEKVIAEVNYNQVIGELDIDRWANEVGRTAFDWLDRKSSLLKNLN